MADPILKVDQITHRYEERVALDALSFDVAPGEIFGLLGPNGSGKTTLFRILSTLMEADAGEVILDQKRLTQEPEAFRERLGVVFQSPSLDPKLTVGENLTHQGHLYGIRGETLHRRMDLLLSQFRINDRFNERVEKLSGGLKRRVEIAKALLHHPKVLLLDEPSTGLDPGARRELWSFLHHVNSEEKVTILVTTHLMDEAERCHRLLLLDKGLKISLDTPVALKAKVTGTVITARCADPEKLQSEVRGRFEVGTVVVDDELRLEWNHTAGTQSPSEFVGKLLELFRTEITSITLAQPTLEDVFIHLTGHEFFVEEPEEN